MPDSGLPTLTIDRYGGGTACGRFSVSALTLISILRSRTAQTLALIGLFYVLSMDASTLGHVQSYLGLAADAQATP